MWKCGKPGAFPGFPRRGGKPDAFSGFPSGVWETFFTGFPNRLWEIGRFSRFSSSMARSGAGGISTLHTRGHFTHRQEQGVGNRALFPVFHHRQYFVMQHGKRKWRTAAEATTGAPTGARLGEGCRRSSPGVKVTQRGAETSGGFAR